MRCISHSALLVAIDKTEMTGDGAHIAYALARAPLNKITGALIANALWRSRLVLKKELDWLQTPERFVGVLAQMREGDNTALIALVTDGFNEILRAFLIDLFSSSVAIPIPCRTAWKQELPHLEAIIAEWRKAFHEFDPSKPTKWYRDEDEPNLKPVAQDGRRLQFLIGDTSTPIPKRVLKSLRNLFKRREQNACSARLLTLAKQYRVEEKNFFALLNAGKRKESARAFMVMDFKRKGARASGRGIIRSWEFNGTSRLLIEKANVKAWERFKELSQQAAATQKFSRVFSVSNRRFGRVA